MARAVESGRELESGLLVESGLAVVESLAVGLKQRSLERELVAGRRAARSERRMANWSDRDGQATKRNFALGNNGR
jgi:hypothetical protein